MAVKGSLTHGLVFDEKELDVGGAYMCLLGSGSARISTSPDPASGGGRASGPLRRFELQSEAGLLGGQVLGLGSEERKSQIFRNEAAEVPDPDRVKRG